MRTSNFLDPVTDNMGAFIFLCVALVTTADAVNRCRGRDYTCPSGAVGPFPGCVPFHAMCDGIPDCLDGTDEQEPVCDSHLGGLCEIRGKFYCKSRGGRNRCMSRLKLCDGRRHCRDGRDEDVTVCGVATVCDDSIYVTLKGIERFAGCTGSHQCIQSSRWCDGKKDCANNADETSSCQDAAIRYEALRAHNTLRYVHQDTPPVTWNLDLASRSQLWADYLSDNNEFKHSPRNSDYRTTSGENIFWSSSVRTKLTNAIYSFYSEEWENNYDYSTGTGTGVIGHFTQVVWDTSTEIGCGVARSQSPRHTIIVCQYEPAGNYVNAYTRHVFRPKPGVDPKTVADALKSNA